MKCEKIWLNQQRNVYIETYLLENSLELHPHKKRPTIVICPGGGYKNLSDREAEPIALKYNSAGFNAIVLKYGVDMNAVMPGPIKDLADAMCLINGHAEEWFVDINNIFIAGFSAGGHLAASLAVFHNDKDVLAEYQDKPIKPKGVILGYPVIDLKSTTNKLDIGIEGFPELETIEFDMKHPNIKLKDIFVRTENKTLINFEIAMNAYMFGGYATEEQILKYSLQNQVDNETCPAFIWHGVEDGLILPDNALKFASAMQANNINYELHIYGSGGHGLSLGNEVTSNYQWELVPEVQNWIEMSIKWVNNQCQ